MATMETATGTGGIDIQIEYFALLRSCARKGQEKLHLENTDAAALYGRLQERYGFPIPRDRIHLAVNDQFSPWNIPLRQGDRVVFVPPVSGG